MCTTHLIFHEETAQWADELCDGNRPILGVPFKSVSVLTFERPSQTKKLRVYIKTRDKVLDEPKF